MKTLLLSLGVAAFASLAPLPASAGDTPYGDDGLLPAGGPVMCPMSDPRCVPPHPPRGPEPFDPGFHPGGPGLGHHRHHDGRFEFGLYFGDAYPRHPGYVIRKARYCTNDMAIGKARAFGIRSIRAYAYPDYILIKGKKRGHRVEVTFSRQWGCPAIQY